MNEHPKPDADRLITTKELAELLKVSTDTICKARTKGYETDRLPPYIKVGKSIRYKLSSVNTWIAQQAECQGETQAKTEPQQGEE